MHNKNILVSILLTIFLSASSTSFADGSDIFYEMSSVYTRKMPSPAIIGVSPYIVPPALAQNAIIYDQIYNVTNDDYDYRLLYIDSVNDQINSTIVVNDFGGESPAEIEVSPLGGSGVMFNYDLNDILFTKDSGLTWFEILLPTSSTHTLIEPALNYFNFDIATFDSTGNLQVFYYSHKTSGSTKYWQANRAVFDNLGNLLTHEILATQDSDFTQPLIVEVTRSYDKVFALMRPSDTWTDAAGTAYKFIPKIYVYEDSTQILTESTHIGTFPSDPDALYYNKLMASGQHSTSNNLTTDGQALFTLTRTTDSADSLGPKEDEEIRRFVYNSTDQFFPDHGSALGTMPLCDLKQLPAFRISTLMTRTNSTDYDGWIEHFAASWNATTSTLEVDIMYQTPDDFEFSNQAPLEFKVARITDPNSSSPSYVIDRSRNDIDCAGLQGKKNPVFCLIFSNSFNSSMVSLEGSVASSFSQYLYFFNTGLAANLFVIDVS